MAEKCIELDSVEIAAAVFGNCDRNIRLLEKEFSVTAVCRGTQLRISGEPANVAAANRAVEGMLLLIENRTPLEDQTVHYCISLAHDGAEKRVKELTEDFVTVTVKGRPIRPKTLGQKEYLSAIRSNAITFGVGPAGTGKTSIAHVIAESTKATFVEVSAIGGTVSDLRREIDAAEKRLALNGSRTILFVDEIHRFNRSQQDALLHAVENRTVVLVGATTENPFFEVNSALISRSRVVGLKGLSDGDVAQLVDRAVADPRGLDGLYKLDPAARSAIVLLAGGDGRASLTTLELAAGMQQPGTRENPVVITKAQVEATIAAFAPGDYLVLQNEVSCLPEMVEAGATRGLHVVLNPSQFADSLRSLDYNQIRRIFINEVEGHQMTGETAPDAILSALRAKYPALCVVLTLGSAGSICCTPEKTVHQPIFRVQAVDTTAAGDSFTGYFLAALTQGLPLETCMARAAAASAISVPRQGAAPSIPRAEEVDAMLRRA